MEASLLLAWVTTQYVAMGRRLGRENDRGDVPGWVMVTVMTAGLVVGIFAAFKTQIGSAVTNAIDSVTNTTSK